MTSLHLALSAADTLGRLLELPRTVRSLAARVDRLIRYVEDLMVELAEAKEGRRVAEEAMDQRDRQWQLVLDSRVNAAEQKLSEATFRAEMAEAALSTSEAEAASATERAKKAEELVATMVGNVHGEPTCVQMAEAYERQPGSIAKFAVDQWRVGYAAGLAESARKVTP